MAVRTPQTPGALRCLAAVSLIALLSGTFSGESHAQYIYLDTNGDGYPTTADLLNPTGSTTLGIWLSTDVNRDGSPAVCPTAAGDLSLRSYEVILHARNGTVAWGAFSNRIAEFTVGAGAQSDGTDYWNGFTGVNELPPGTYLLATLDVSMLSGTPSLDFGAATSLGPGLHTGFGSACAESSSDGLFKLGVDWNDADGVPWGVPADRTVTLAQPSNMALVEGASADQALSATDSDGLPVAFTLESGPAFATVTTISSGTGTATGSVHLAPGYSDAGVTIASVLASDGFSSDTRTFVITVAEGNRAPILTQPPDMMIGEGTVRDQSLSASDADLDLVTFFKVAGPDYMTVTTVDSYYGVGLMHFTPGFNDAGMTMGEVGATDGTLADMKMFSIMIRNADRAPVLTLPPDPTAAEGALLRFDVTAVDPDGDMVTLTAAGLPVGAAFHDDGDGTGNFAWVPGYDQAGVYVVVFTATGMPGAAATAPLTITVTDSSQTVGLAQPLDMKLLEGATADQTLRAMDQSGDPLAFSAVMAPPYMTVTTTSPGAGLAEGNVHLAPGLSDAGDTIAEVEASDGVNRDRKSFAISVTDAGPGEGGPPFSTPLASIATGLTPHTVTFADVNRDGHLDLVTANMGSSTVSVMRGRGDGTFLSPMVYATAAKPHTAALDDLNGDGWLDLAVSNMGANSLGVMLGLGDGTFGTRTDIPIAGSPMFLGIVDLDGNGSPDFVATNLTLGTLAVLMGHGDGTFSPPVEYPAGAKAHGLAIGDLNRDGKPDVVVANPGTSTVSVLVGVGDGTLRSRGDLVTSAPHTAAIGDLNRDGVPDLAIANFDASTISVLIGSGDGTFRAEPDLYTGEGAHAAMIRDIDGDGMTDLIAANQIANTVSFFMGHGDGSFGSKSDFSNGQGAHAIAAGDLNEDGALDLAVSNIVSNTVTIFLNRRPPPPVHPARAFLVDRNTVIPLGRPAKPLLKIQVEPVGDSYGNVDVLLETVSMVLEGSGSGQRIPARADKSVAAGDQDRNGIDEIGVCFSNESLSLALAGLRQGPHSVPATIEGALATGGGLRASLVLRVVSLGKGHSASVSPNPLNPEATLSFVTGRRGFARVRVFDSAGRMVGTLLDAPDSEAGTHTVPIDATGGVFGKLSSGLYFYRVETLEAVSVGRFVVLK